MKGKELTEEEIAAKRCEEEGEYQRQWEHDDAVHEAELDIKEAELESKIKELEELRRSRRWGH